MDGDSRVEAITLAGGCFWCLEAVYEQVDGVVAVDHLSFTVERGELVALIGPNGAGKTSTVECLEGFRRPTAGARGSSARRSPPPTAHTASPMCCRVPTT